MLFTGGQLGIQASVLGHLEVLNSKPIHGTSRQLLYLPPAHSVDIPVCGKRSMWRDILGNLSGMNNLAIWLLTIYKMTGAVLLPHKDKGLENKSLQICINKVRRFLCPWTCETWTQ